MTDNGQENGVGASAAAVAGLAAEVDSLRRRIESLETLPGWVQQLAELTDKLTGELARLAPQSTGEGPPSWLMAPAEPECTRRLLDELTEWLSRVFLRYGDGAAVVPDCWPWHADVVEELLWLMRAWLAAYQGPKASVALVADWHDRYRPGVVRRIRASAGTCSLENHTPPQPPPPVPAADAVEPIAVWWADNRQAPPPEPTSEQLAAGSRRGRTGGRR